LDATEENHAGGATSVITAVAARDPAVLKPAILDIVANVEFSEPGHWLLARLANREPALLQRQVANSLWTLQQALDNGDNAVMAVRSLAAVLRSDPDLLPEHTIFRQVLNHPDPDMRRVGAEAIPALVAASRNKDSIKWTTVRELLVRELQTGERYNREVAATALGYLGVCTGINPDRIVGQLTARLADPDRDVRRELIGAIQRLVTDAPEARHKESVKRLATFLTDANASETLATIRAHGETALTAIDIDTLAVLLGNDTPDTRKQTIETLVSLGVASPTHRSDILDTLRWALYDDDRAVRQAAVEAVGIAGRQWPCTTPTAVEALFAHLTQWPDDRDAVADALAEISAGFTGAVPAFIERAGRNHTTATVAAFLQAAADIDPDSVLADLDWLVDCTHRPTDEGGGDAAHALLSVAESDPGALAPYPNELREILADGPTADPHWATLARTLGIVAESNGSDMHPAEWLSRRFHSDPLVFGPALARLVTQDPQTAFPPIAGLLTTLQRSHGEVADIDTEAVLDDVIAELIGSHPIAALPVVRTLIALLERGTCQIRVTRLLGDALDAWPYLAPIATESLVHTLDKGDTETLSALSYPLVHVGNTAAGDALEQLETHPSPAVRAAVTEAKRYSPPHADVDLDAYTADDVDQRTVDQIAAALGSEQTSQAAHTLKGIANDTPEHRPRIVAHLLGYVGAKTGDDVSPVVVDTITSLMPDVAISGESARSMSDGVAVVCECCGDADPIITAQALSVLHTVVKNDPKAIETHAVPRITERVTADSPLVQYSAMQATRPLIRDGRCDTAELAVELESSLFSPHALVPVAAWTLSEIALADPESITPVASSLTGLQDWDILARYNATETIRVALASDPSMEAVFAESLLTRLADERPVSPELIKAVGLLSGECIADQNGVDAVLSALDSAQSGSQSFRLAELLRRTAATAPEHVLGALADRETLPKACSGSVLELFRTIEQLLAHDPSGLTFPCLDVLVLFDRAHSVELSEAYDRRPVAPTQSKDARSQAKRAGARIMAKSGNDTFLTLLRDYDTGEPAVPLSPELVGTYVSRTDSAEAREEAIEKICTEVPEEMRNGITEQLIDRIATEQMDSYRRLVPLLPSLAAAATDRSIVESVVTVIRNGLSSEWNLRLAAVDALGELGRTDAIDTRRAGELLIDTLDDTEPTVRRRAAEALRDVCLRAVIDVEAVVEKLTRLLDGSMSATGRYGAAIALGLLAADEPGVRNRIVGLLAEASETSDDLLRQRCLEALATVTDAEPAALDGHLQRIGPHVTDRVFDVQLATIECMAATASVPMLRSSSTRYLTEALTATDGRVKERAAQELTEITRTNPDLSHGCIETIRTCLDAGPPSVRAALATCLSYVGSQSDITTLQPLTADDVKTVRTAATEGIARLKQRQRPAPSTWDGAPMYRYNAANRGCRSLNGPRIDNPAVDWQFSIDESIKAAPTAIGDMVYVSGEDNWIYALSAARGDQQWVARRDDWHPNRFFGRDVGPDLIRSSPAVVGEDLYIGNHHSKGAEVYNLHAETGKRQWGYAADADVFSSPAVVDRTVYIGSGDGDVIALNAVTGTEQWTACLGGRLNSSPTVSGGMVYIGSHDGTVHALTTDDGTESWCYHTDDYVTSTPAVKRSTVYVASYDETVYALDAISGTELWAVETGSPVQSSPAVSDGTVYVGTSDAVVALDASTGTQKWVVHSTGGASVAVRGDTVYASGHEGVVTALDAADGATRWTVDLRAPVVAPPVVEDDTVYVATSEGCLYAIRE
jgi:outer membrane protein assembly factor BamB/HEAT repeat protein